MQTEIKNSDTGIAPMHAKNMFDKEMVKRLETALRSAPLPDLKMTRNDALQALAPELRRQLERGHTVDSLADLLGAAGLQVSQRTVGKMLRTTKSTKMAMTQPLICKMCARKPAVKGFFCSICRSEAERHSPLPAAQPPAPEPLKQEEEGTDIQRERGG